MAPLAAKLLSLGFSALAPVVAAKGKEFIETKLDVDLDEMLGSEQGRIQLKQLEMEHQEFLITAAQASEVRDLEYFKEEAAEKASARLRDSEFLKAGKENWRAHFMFGLALIVIMWLVYIIWKTPELNEYTKGVFTLILGRFTGYLDNIYQFEFGSTRVSKTKDATIEHLSRGR